LQELSRFQAVSRDFSLALPEAVRWEEISAALQALALPELLSYAPRELLRPQDKVTGGVVEAGHYSLLLSTVFQSQERTLKEEEVQGWSQEIVGALMKLGGRLRG
jgi:phenylalanyl-tRNA synthetase beta chain